VGVEILDRAGPKNADFGFAEGRPDHGPIPFRGNTDTISANPSQLVNEYRLLAEWGIRLPSFPIGANCV
jgi:hypothetical protein